MTKPDSDYHFIMKFLYISAFAVLSLLVGVGVLMCRKKAPAEKVAYSQSIPK